MPYWAPNPFRGRRIQPDSPQRQKAVGVNLGIWYQRWICQMTAF